jgi:hypothetical protein
MRIHRKDCLQETARQLSDKHKGRMWEAFKILAILQPGFTLHACTLLNCRRGVLVMD